MCGRRFGIVTFELFHPRRGLACGFSYDISYHRGRYNIIRVEKQTVSEMSILETYWIEHSDMIAMARVSPILIPIVILGPFHIHDIPKQLAYHYGVAKNT
jgi:hypothetical protein